MVPQNINPANGGVDPLLLLSCAALPMGKNGCLLHARLRYFDPVRAATLELQSSDVSELRSCGQAAKRAGLPPDCAALIEAMDAASVTVSLVNVGETERTVTVQAGAYAEHTLRTVSVDDGPAQVLGDGDSTLTVVLPPHCGGRLTLGMSRYAKRPSLRLPWQGGARM